MRLLEEWKLNFDKNMIVGGVLMDLSKAFHCIPSDLLIAKLESYGFQGRILKIFHSYLKDPKQCVKINITSSSLKIISSGVSQGFNLFIK